MVRKTSVIASRRIIEKDRLGRYYRAGKTRFTGWHIHESKDSATQNFREAVFTESNHCKRTGQGSIIYHVTVSGKKVNIIEKLYTIKLSHVAKGEKPYLWDQFYPGYGKRLRRAARLPVSMVK